MARSEHLQSFAVETRIQHMKMSNVPPGPLGQILAGIARLRNFDCS
jgi:hypothetical protein